MPSLAYRRIGRPAEAHGVRTPEEYRARQRKQLIDGRRAFPERTWPDQWLVIDPAAAEVNAGRWIVRCTCGNAPSVDPEWGLACCLECFAIFERVLFPDDRETGERLLMARPEMRNRNWLPHEGVEDLRLENLRHGHEVTI